MVGRFVPMLLASLLAALALAGCSSASGGKSDLHLANGQDVDLEAAAHGAGADGSQGVISGVVVDATIRPVPGANVTVSGDTATARTDANGIFVIAGLKPGLYTLQVKAENFLPAQTSAEVKAGTTTKVRVQLEAHFVPKPYHGTTVKFRGFYQASSGFADEVLDLAVWNHTYAGQTLPNGCTCRFSFGADVNLTTVVMELTWDEAGVDHSAPDQMFGGGWTLDVTDDQGKGPLQFCTDYAMYKPPCIIHENSLGNFSAAGGRYSIGVWSDPGWVYVNENFELLVTPFYVAPAPADWSAIHGGT